MISGFNVSLVAKSSSVHSPTCGEDKKIDDCILSLERNESDAIFFPYTIPLIRSNIKTGPVFFSDKIQIFSTYKVEKENPNPGILDTFDAFSVDALALILNFFVILAVLIFLTYILERKSLSRGIRINGHRFKLRFVPWFIFRFFVKQYPSLPGNMTALKALLTCCLLTFSYFVTFFYSSMIKTDMVTVKAPRVIASYQDILDDPSIRPYIRHTFDEYISFKHAEEGSIKKKIWERVLKMGVNRLVYNDDSLDSNEDGVPDTDFWNPENPFMHSKAVLMFYASPVDIVKYSSALYFKSLKNRKGLYVSDPMESAKVSASVINRMTAEVVSLKYEGRMRRFFEGRFFTKFLQNSGLLMVEVLDFFVDVTGLGKDISDADEYMNEKVVLPEPVLVKPNISYYKFLFISYLVSCVIQIIVFLIERWVCDKDYNIA